MRATSSPCLSHIPDSSSSALTELLQGRSLDSLENFPEPGFDMDEITAVANLEIHFVDSSGVVSWDFLGEEPDHAFADWNFSTTTQEDYGWLCACIAGQTGASLPRAPCSRIHCANASSSKRYSPCASLVTMLSA